MVSPITIFSDDGSDASQRTFLMEAAEPSAMGTMFPRSPALQDVSSFHEQRSAPPTTAQLFSSGAEVARGDTFLASSPGAPSMAVRRSSSFLQSSSDRGLFTDAFGGRPATGATDSTGHAPQPDRIIMRRRKIGLRRKKRRLVLVRVGGAVAR